LHLCLWRDQLILTVYTYIIFEGDERKKERKIEKERKGRRQRNGPSLRAETSSCAGDSYILFYLFAASNYNNY
jgi:hypothetical protein